MVICLRSLQWSGGEVSLVGQGEKSVGGAENLTWNLKNLPSKLKFFLPTKLYSMCLSLIEIFS